MSDADLAERIRADRIDVLVDLAMHMAHNRMIAFAHKPAPVQAAWLAYPGGTGLDAMDYRITDAYMDPPDKTTAYYREQSYRVPDCWCCYDACCNAPAAAPRPDRPIRFASINNPCKHNDATLSLWAGVMRGIPESRLLMQAFSESDRKRIRSIFQNAAVAPNGSNLFREGFASIICVCTMRSTSASILFPTTESRRPAMHCGWAFPW